MVFSEFGFTNEKQSDAEVNAFMQDFLRTRKGLTKEITDIQQAEEKIDEGFARQSRPIVDKLSMLSADIQKQIIKTSTDSNDNLIAIMQTLSDDQNAILTDLLNELTGVKTDLATSVQLITKPLTDIAIDASLQTEKANILLGRVKTINKHLREILESNEDAKTRDLENARLLQEITVAVESLRDEGFDVSKLETIFDEVHRDVLRTEEANAVLFNELLNQQARTQEKLDDVIVTFGKNPKPNEADEINMTKLQLETLNKMLDFLESGKEGSDGKKGVPPKAPPRPTGKPSGQPRPKVSVERVDVPEVPEELPEELPELPEELPEETDVPEESASRLPLLVSEIRDDLFPEQFDDEERRFFLRQLLDGISSEKMTKLVDDSKTAVDFAKNLFFVKRNNPALLSLMVDLNDILPTKKVPYKFYVKDGQTYLQGKSVDLILDDESASASTQSDFQIGDVNFSSKEVSELLFPDSKIKVSDKTKGKVDKMIAGLKRRGRGVRDELKRQLMSKMKDAQVYNPCNPRKSTKLSSGSGAELLLKRKAVFVNPQDPNDLIARLSLLTGLHDGGNRFNRTISSEISFIIDRLYQLEVIDREKHRMISKKYLRLPKIDELE